MIAIWTAIALAVSAGIYALVDVQYVQSAPTIASASLAQSMAAYRQALMAYALANPSFEGSVSSGALAAYLPAGTPAGPWLNYMMPNGSVAGSVVVVYTASSGAASAIAGIEKLADGSALAGVAHAGTIVSPGNPAVPLPAAIASLVPDGTPVWMGQAYLP